MSLCLVQSRALLGLEAASVTVEVHLANGLPSFTLVGLVDVEVKEARERVRSAIQNKRITVNLAPADLPKDSGRFDLPIALGILAASGQIDAARLAGHEFAGELSLSGQLRPVRGALAMAVALHTSGVATRLVLPAHSAQEASLVPGAEVYGARHLLDVVQQFLPADSEQAPAAEGWMRIVPSPASPADGHADLADVKGHAGAKRALEIAAAGNHSLLMVGPPGSGKSMLAQRFAGLLPAMSVDEALETAAVASLGGRFDTGRWMRRPTSSPHHTASAVALVGGGSPPRPGEISLAHHGVLFLDEVPEFSRMALEALREPLETGTITIVRAARRSEFPARFQLIAAMHRRSYRGACGVGRTTARHACRRIDPGHPRACGPCARTCTVAARQDQSGATGRRDRSACLARPRCAEVHAHGGGEAGVVGTQYAPRAEGGPHDRGSGRIGVHCSRARGGSGAIPACAEGGGLKAVPLKSTGWPRPQ